MLDCSLVKTSCGQIVPSVVSVAAYDLVVPSIVTLNVLLVHSCFGLYKT